MKKAVSMILVIAVLLSCMTMTAFAGSTKISDTLAQRIEQTSDSQRITVHVWLYSYVDKEAARRQATKECGYISGLPLNMTLDEVYAYKAAYNRIVSEQEAAVADSFVEKLGIAQEDIVYLGKHPYVIANLTKEQIESASACPEVESIRCEPEEGTPTELPTESDPAVPPYLYKDRFVEKYIDADEQGAWGYRELYYHKDENGETDWALVQGYQPMVSPLEYVTVVANRVLSPYNIYYPFSARYGIYDVKADAFIDAGGREAKSYPDFVHVFDETVTEGRLLGDLDRDNTISVIDATIIQRCEANLRDFPEDDIFYVTYEWGNPRYYSDFDRDGERDITDTTAIQRYLVGIS